MMKCPWCDKVYTGGEMCGTCYEHLDWSIYNWIEFGVVVFLGALAGAGVGVLLIGAFLGLWSLMH